MTIRGRATTGDVGLKPKQAPPPRRAGTIFQQGVKFKNHLFDISEVSIFWPQSQILGGQFNPLTRTSRAPASPGALTFTTTDVFWRRWVRTSVSASLDSPVVSARRTSTNASLRRVQTAARASTSLIPSAANVTRATPEVGVPARWTAVCRHRAWTRPRVTRCRSPPEATCARAQPDILAICVRRSWTNVLPVRVLTTARVLTP